MKVMTTRTKLTRMLLAMEGSKTDRATYLVGIIQDASYRIVFTEKRLFRGFKAEEAKHKGKAK
jgi:hypothetical protein